MASADPQATFDYQSQPEEVQASELSDSREGDLFRDSDIKGDNAQPQPDSAYGSKSDTTKEVQQVLEGHGPSSSKSSKDIPSEITDHEGPIEASLNEELASMNNLTLSERENSSLAKRDSESVLETVQQHEVDTRPKNAAERRPLSEQPQQQPQQLYPLGLWSHRMNACYIRVALHMAMFLVYLIPGEHKNQLNEPGQVIYDFLVALSQSSPTPGGSLCMDGVFEALGSLPPTGASQPSSQYADDVEGSVVTCFRDIDQLLSLPPLYQSLYDVEVQEIRWCEKPGCCQRVNEAQTYKILQLEEPRHAISTDINHLLKKFNETKELLSAENICGHPEHRNWTKRTIVGTGALLYTTLRYPKSQEKTPLKLKPDINVKVGEEDFTLRALVCHIGDAWNTGHFHFVKVAAGEAFEIDDHMVRETRLSQHQEHVYLAVYSKQSNKLHQC